MAIKEDIKHYHSYDKQTPYDKYNAARLFFDLLHIQYCRLRSLIPVSYTHLMGGADFVNVLFSEFLVYDPENPRWEGRDRFFLDPGQDVYKRQA